MPNFSNVIYDATNNRNLSRQICESFVFSRNVYYSNRDNRILLNIFCYKSSSFLHRSCLIVLDTIKPRASPSYTYLSLR